MSDALIEANMSPGEISILNAHATSTIVGDMAEIKAVTNLFGRKALRETKDFMNVYKKDEAISDSLLADLCVVAFKSQLGHTVAAAGGIESAIGIKAMNENYLWEALNMDAPASDLLNFKRSGKMEIKNMMKNSFAFGGVNSSVVFGKVN